MQNNKQKTTVSEERDQNSLEGKERDFSEILTEGEQTEEESYAQLKTDLSAAKNEAAENYDRMLRLMAEFENYKKRVQKQMEDHRKYANESLVKELLSVVDNLERAIHASNGEKADEDAGVVEGVEMTLNEILKLLKKYNVTPIDALGKPFDPAYHEAVMQEHSNVYPENTVTTELQKGYLLHDRLIRPTMVVVSKGASQKE